MRQQQNDPIAQAMQILQLVTQRRGQQADIEQGGRRLDLQEQQLQQGNEQFNQGLQWDQKQFDQRNQQWEAEQEQKRIQQIVENTRYNMAQPVDQAYKQMLIDKSKREDPRMTLAQIEEDKMIVAALQEQLNLAPQMEQGRIRDQIQAYLTMRHKNKLPPRRDYNQAELNAQQMFQTPQQ